MSTFPNTSNGNVAFSAPTSVVPLKYYPSFSVNHYSKQCSSRNFPTRTSVAANTSGIHSFPRMGKRKSNSTESTFHPLTKQQITEARIAASMQKLSLDNSQHAPNHGDGLHSVRKTTEDEGFYDDDIECDTDPSTSTGGENSRGGRTENFLPQFELADGVKDNINNMINDILPEQIFKSMSQNCLALIPYVPPVNVLTLPSDADVEDTITPSPLMPKTRPHWDISDDEAMSY